MTTPENEIGARLVLSGKSSFVEDAAAARTAVKEVGVAANRAGTEAERGGAKFTSMSNRVKTAGVRMQHDMGVAGARGGEALGAGVARGARESEGAVRHAGREAGEGFGRGAREGSSEMLKGLVGPLLAFMAFDKVGESLREATLLTRQMGQAQRQTAAVMKSTHGVAHVTADDMKELSEHTALYGQVTKPAAQGALNMLLSFSRVRNEAGKGNEIFNRAAVLASDVSARFGVALPGAMKLLGRALSNPAKAAGALSRIIGGPLTKSQSDYLKHLVATGRTLEAQRWILGKVETAVGGAAKANVTAGDRVRMAWEDVELKVGGKLLPMFNRLEGWFVDKGLPMVEKFGESIKNFLAPTLSTIHDLLETYIIPDLKEFLQWAGPVASKIMKTLGDWIKKYVLPVIVAVVKWLATDGVNALKSFGGWVKKNQEWIKPLVVAFVAGYAALKLWAIGVMVVGKVTAIWEGIQAAFNAVMAANPIMIAVIAIAALAAGFIYAYKHSKTFRDIVKDTMHGVNVAIKAVATAAKWVWNHGLKQVFGWIGSAIKWVGDHFGMLATIFLTVATGGLYPIIKGIVNHFGGIKKIISDIGDLFKHIGDGFAWAWDHIIKPVYDKVVYAIDHIKSFLNTLTGGVFGTGGRGGYSGKSGPSASDLGKLPDLSGLQGLDLSGLSGLSGLAPPSATGTAYHPGGLGWVGENGRELINIPRGSELANNPRSERLIEMSNHLSAKARSLAAAKAGSVPSGAGTGRGPITIAVQLNKKTIAQAVYDETARLAGYQS